VVNTLLFIIFKITFSINRIFQGIISKSLVWPVILSVQR